MILHLLLGANRVTYFLYAAVCAIVLFFLVFPISVVVPLSFNLEPYFTFPLAGVSTRWYRALLESESWRLALKNSISIGLATTALATVLGTLAALGLSRPNFPFRTAVMALLLAPVAVPVIVTAVGLYFLYSRVGLANSLLGLVLAHTTIAVPFVVVTVTATLSSFNHDLIRAAASLGASPLQSFIRVSLPLVLPGIVSGAIFAFITSFDDVVIALFLAGGPQWTLPRQMWSGVRENIDPTILAAATLLVAVSALVLIGAEWLRHRNERLRTRAP